MVDADSFAACANVIIGFVSVSAVSAAALALGLGVSQVVNGISGSASAIRGSPYITLIANSDADAEVIIVYGSV